MSKPSVPHTSVPRQSPEKTADQTNTPRKAKPCHKRPSAGLYCRVRSPGQEEDGTSLDTQEARGRHYAYAACVEVEKIRERSVRGKRSRLQNGKIHNFGTELYGYRRNKVDGKREVYEPEACIVRQLFRWYAEEKVGVRSIVRWLNEQRIPPPSSSKGLWQDLERRPYWNQGQIHRILREPAYKGLTISWRYDKVGRLKPETEWLSLPEGVTPALVDSALWEAAQKHRTSNTGAQIRNQARP
jgi:hypothetical protein